MSDNQQSSGTSNSPPRRSSFAGQALAEIFGVSRARSSYDNPNTNQSNPVNQYPGSVASAAAQAQRRRMSVTGASQPIAFNGKRSDSVSSANSNYIDEQAVEDGEPISQSSPTTPFARRMSFGARALRDVRAGSGPATAAPTSSNGRSSYAESGVSAGDGVKKTTPPSIKGRETGYNWADSFRNRAERRSSIASSPGGSPNPMHNRAKSVATMQPATRKEVPQPNVPDHFQERILKGDFYMD
ncbi:hypothetical protein K461DRAFT_289165 [Myriangium duriaei CBS 260.36]|uniref:Uncharacterized protein n=1 Tax=Myriangium duriaei CBS 260.36 TaxID=1168546 RepID=A0A9P4J7H6_9PEZI|nr:hypothetical protein K461DRAFT_289165 [Myriangium duriaei CBS 260.36]